MKNTMKQLALCIFLVAVTTLGFSQATLTQTSLSAAVGGGSGQGSLSGITTRLQTQVTLTSVTGVTAPLNGVPQTLLYIDRELMAVMSVNTTSKVATVIRGYNSTPATPHANTAMVLLGTQNQFSAFDPSGACTAASTVSTPWLNVVTGMQWLCSSYTSTWVPGWGNPGTSGNPIAATATVASVAGATLPSGPLFHVTGTNAITSWTLPVGFSSGSFCAIADSGIWTWTAAGNISVLGTVTAANGVPVCFTYDPVTAKWYPSRVT